ncbi:MAG: GspE/PulE family protein [Mucilaginibacter sp.]|uniref:GspE/PulE family protein n=1 Tax=Mucilaginibacter sp. TaxID=1882438 RepID=UPI00319FF850
MDPGLGGQITLLTAHLHMLGRQQAWHYRVLPKHAGPGFLELYCGEKVDTDGLRRELEIVLGCRIELYPIAEELVTRLLSQYYVQESAKGGAPLTPVNQNAEDFLVSLIREAKNLKSSDIHIERYEKKCRVRIRIDGNMVERHLLNSEDYPALINKIKIKAELDIAEKRLPQDGRINFSYQQYQFDIRVSVLPTLYGEKVVLRLLNNDATGIELTSLGFSEMDLNHYLQGAKRPNGLLLISGPTGSGKTTTLYATLKLLNKETRNILTIEDPVEYTLEGVNQVQLRESIGLTFGAALRTFLRQDPDVIMVGEIRDPETAGMAIRAALTGHLVLSTIHTNSAWGIVSRLTDMGVPPFQVADTLNTAAAQRLIRLLCPNCKLKKDFDKRLYPGQFKPFLELRHHYVAGGCEHCFYTGYKGRKAVYEVIPVDLELAREIKAGNSQIRELLRDRGIQTLAENAFYIFSAGDTTLEEIYPLLFNY